MAGIKLTHIPYKGSAPALQDVMGGRLSAMVEGLAAFTGALASNSVKPLAVSSLTRLPNNNWAVDSFFDITYRVDDDSFVEAGVLPRASGNIRASTAK